MKKFSLKSLLIGSLLLLTARSGLALTDEEAIDPLLAAYSVRSIPGDSYEKKLKYSLPKELVKRCSELVVNGQRKVFFTHDNSIHSFNELINEFHEGIQHQKTDLVNVTLCQKKFVIEKKFIGQGKRSYVYALADGKSILKVPKAGVGSFLRMIQERDQYPEVAQIADKFKLHIGETAQVGQQGSPSFLNGYDDSGLFAVKKRVNGETLSDYFFRYKILTIDEKDPKNILIHKEEAANDKNTNFIWNELKKYFAASVAYPEIVADLKSTNFMVTYKDNSYKSEVTGLHWVDTGKHEVEKSKFYRAPDFTYDKYLENMKRIIQEERDGGVDSVSEVKFEDLQKDASNLPVTTMFGNQVRMAEVSKPILEHLMAHLKSETCAKKVKILGVFANGSRVATRDKVLELEPQLKSALPLVDDGVVKNSIRNGGITNHSNLSMVVIIDKASWPETTEKLREYSFQVSSKISDSFRLYPLTIRFKAADPKPSNSSLSDTEYYYEKALEYQTSREKTLPRSSTARLDALVPSILKCDSSSASGPTSSGDGNSCAHSSSVLSGDAETCLKSVDSAVKYHGK